ncbi:MAG: hypothetical protein M0030_09640 [Actinomycetota bacterium]|nr:hypothetical protein [Actinomycetota bacterium]
MPDERETAILTGLRRPAGQPADSGAGGQSGAVDWGGPGGRGESGGRGGPGGRDGSGDRNGSGDQDRLGAGDAPRSVFPSRAGADLRAATDLGVAAARALRGWFPRTGDWAIRRSLTPNALSGIALLLALCAAAWISGGTTADIGRGSVLVIGWLALRAAAQRLANFVAARQAAQSSRSLVRSARGLDGSTDWLVLPGMFWPANDRGAADARAAQARAASLRGARNFGWLAAVSAAAAEFAIYGGIAAYGQSDRWTTMWPLAVLAAAAVAVTGLIIRCAERTAPPGRPAAADRGTRGVIARALNHMLGAGPGARVLIAWLALAIHGPRIALFIVLVIEVLTACLAVARRARQAIGARRRPVPAAGRAAAAAGAAGDPPEQADAPVGESGGTALLRACRDDGPVAAWAGRLVQGKLTPLPPLLIGLTATILLAVLGMRNLPGVVTLAPLIVLLLAAPGAGHPHDGPVDWLVPALLLTGQYVYLAALGYAQPVSGPIIFALCALTGIWYLSLAVDPREAPGVVRAVTGPGPARRAGVLTAGIGWEGRMFLAGLAAIFGIASFGYLVLAAYLGLLIGRRVLAGRQRAGEDDRR